MLSESETIAAASDCLPPLGQRSDRQAAHYYRSMHARAVQREEHWKERALAGQQIIKQLLVLVGWCVQQIEGLKRQLAWLKKQQFGRKSEATQAADAVAQPEVAAGPGAGPGAGPEEAAIEPGAKDTTAQPRRRRGQQRGSKGPKRHRRLNLPQETTHHTLAEAERTCSNCGKIRPETGLTEESEEIE